MNGYKYLYIGLGVVSVSTLLYFLLRGKENSRIEK
jgi:hypothetical protein